VARKRAPTQYGGGHVKDANVRYCNFFEQFGFDMLLTASPGEFVGRRSGQRRSKMSKLEGWRRVEKCDT
jgi:hypothetical protein